ncbi:phage tail tape measure protein [Streptomyces sp. NPDC090442]|uniref:phage tail tape measure protein n=1 Tax=Streptomyces sp. NPDC090442 TaxID=3365962 RepID=UPI00381A4157
MALRVGELFASLRVDDSQFRARMATAQGQLSSAGQTAARVGGGMSKWVTAPLVGVAAAAIKTGGDFQASMNRVKAVSGATGSQFADLEKLAKEMGSTTQYSASEAADAMGYMAMAGMKSKDITQALPGVLNLAAAGNIALADAADIATNVLSGYGLQTKDLAHLNDVLAKTFTSTNTDMKMLGESFKYVAPVASSAGLAIEETSAAIGMMGNAGIQGSEAGTALRGAIASLLKPTGDTEKILKKLGVSVVDSHGKLRPLVSIVGQLEKAGASTADMMGIFGVEAGPAMQALVTQGSGALKKLTKDLKNSGGTAKNIADVQMEGFNGQMKGLQSAVEGLMLAIAGSGILQWATTFAEKLTALASKLSQTDSGLLRTGTVVALAAAALGPLVIAVGKTMSALSSSLSTIASFARGTVNAASAIGRMAVAAGTYAARIAVVTAQSVAAGARMAASAAATAARVVAGWVLMGAQALAQAARMAAAWVMAMGPVGWIITAVVGLVALIVAKWDAIKSATAAAWGWIWNKIKGVAQFLVDLFLNFTLPGLIIKHWDSIKAGTVRVWTAIVDWVKQLPRRIVDFFLNWTLVGLIIKHWSAIKDGTQRKAGEMLDWVRGLPARIVSYFGNFGSMLYGKGRDLIVGLWNGIKAMGSWLRNTLMGWAKDLIPGPIARALGIHSPSRVMRDQIGRHIPSGIVEGIKAGAPAVDRTMRSLVSVPSAPQLATAGTTPTNPTSQTGGWGASVHIENWHAGGQSADQVAASLAWQMKGRG